MLSLQSGVYVVAGAGGGGIGTQTCATLAAAGAHVLALDRDAEGCKTARSILGDDKRHCVVQVDLMAEDGVAEIFAAAQQRFGPLRGLVNVVGGLPSADLIAPLLDDGELDRFDRLMRLNTVPALVAGRSAASLMRSHGRGGSIVNTASASGHVSMAFGAGYGAAKAALMNLTRTMAVEWGPFDIRVNAVSPGTIRTATVGRGQLPAGEPGRDDPAMGTIPLRRRGVPGDIANGTLFLLSDLASYITGQVLDIDGGMMARPPFNDHFDVPVFMTAPALRARLR